MPLLRIGASTPGTIGQKFRTFAALDAALGVTVAGTRAALWGPVDKCGWWRSEGGGDVRIDSDVDLSVLDGSETSGTDIVQLGSANAPTWGTPGASGGMIMDGSGSLSLVFLGELPSQLLGIGALGIPTLTAEVNGMAFSVGSWRLNAASDVCFLGGIRRITGFWARTFAFDLNSAPIYGGAITAAYREPITTGNEVMCARASIITNSPSNAAGSITGSYRGDSAGAPVNQQASATTSGPATAAVRHRTMLNVRDNGGTMSVRWTKLFVLAGERAGGITP